MRVVARSEWALLETRPAGKNGTHIHVKFESSGRLCTAFYGEKKNDTSCQGGQ